MRTIKFRAWDPERKVILPSVGFTDNDCGRTWKRERYMIDDGSNAQSRQWIPMQFTGLLDKNGKEIYESDIVEDRLSGEIHEVVFEKLCWRMGSGGELLGNYAAPEEDLKVLGNIYENPELLSNSDSN